MAWNNVQRSLDCIAASNLNLYTVVTGDTTTANQVITAGSANVDAVGVVYQATVPTYGYSVNIARQGEVKVYFAASTGAWSRVAVASNNGAVGPVASLYPASTPILSGRTYSIGYTTEPHAAGDLGTIVLDPRELV